MKQFLFPGLLTVALSVALHGAYGSSEMEMAGILQPLITTSELVVGKNRFAFGLMKAQRFLDQANVVVRIYAIEGNDARLTAETNAPYRPVDGTEQGQRVHHHADGARHVHRDEIAVLGLYVTQVTFTRSGTWGVEIMANRGDRFETARTKVTVLDSPLTPVLASPAPRRHNFVATDVPDLRHIDTSERPDPRTYRVRIADTIKLGKPQVIVFATPQFCTSRMCGPVVGIVRKLHPAYGKRAAFIYQEIWQDFARQKLFPTVEEWRIHSEPWIFMVDGEGIIRAKFEGLVTVRELEAALQQTLTRLTVRRP